jgi:RNA polymerase sigma-70 factor, ECF subfamily
MTTLLQTPSRFEQDGNQPLPSINRQSELESAIQVYGGRMHVVAQRLLRCPFESADAVQEAYLSAWTQLPRFRGTCRIETWLHRIVVNRCLMRLRARGRRQAVSLDDEFLPVFNDTELFETDHEEFRGLLRAAVQQLSERYRTVIQLRFFEGFSTAETAELLGVNPSVVKTRLHRGCSALRRILMACDREEIRTIRESRRNRIPAIAS